LELVCVEDVAQERCVLGIGKRAMSKVMRRVHDLVAVKERQGKPLLIVMRAIVEAVGLLGMAP